jgi:hypothetical protein
VDVARFALPRDRRRQQECRGEIHKNRSPRLISACEQGLATRRRSPARRRFARNINDTPENSAVIMYPRAPGAVPVSKPDNPDLSLINCDSASLKIVLHESHNRAPKFLEFRPNFACSPRRRPPKKQPKSTHLSGSVTAGRPGKSDASEGRPAIKREFFALSLALIEWTAMHVISLISASRWIGGLALNQWTFCGHLLDCLRRLRSRSDQPEISRFRAFACAGPMNRREASPTNQRKFRRLDCGFAGCPANQRKRHQSSDEARKSDAWKGVWSSV